MVSTWLMICQPLSAPPVDGFLTIHRTLPRRSITLVVAKHAPALGMNSMYLVTVAGLVRHFVETVRGERLGHRGDHLLGGSVVRRRDQRSPS